MSTFSGFVCNTLESVFGELPAFLVKVLDKMVNQLVQGLPLKESCGFSLKEAEMFVNETLCPLLKAVIESVYQGSPDPKMLRILSRHLVKALLEERQSGEIQNIKYLLKNLNNVMPSHFYITFKTRIMKNVKNLIESVIEKAPKTYSEFVKALANSLCEAALPEVKEQMMSAIDRLIDDMANTDQVQDIASIITLVVRVLTPYIQIDVLKCLESTMKATLKRINLSVGNVLKRTGAKAFDRVTKKVREATLCSSLPAENIHEFEEFVWDLLTTTFSDLKVEIKKEFMAIFRDVRERVKQGVDEYISQHLIPKLSDLIESMCGASPEKHLRILKPFITQGLEVFLKEGRILNKGEIIKLARSSIPSLITETAIPNASESTKKSFEKVVRTATNTAFDTGLTRDVITNSLPVAATEILIPEASESTKKMVQDVLNTVKEIVFAFGTTPSVENLLGTLLAKCGDKWFCLCKDKFSDAIDDLIAKLPDDTDKIMEFMLKYVLPALSVCFEASAFGLVTIFLLESSRRVCKEGRVKGRDFIKPLASKAAGCALNAAKNKVVNKGIEEVSTVVTEKVVTKKITHKLVEECVIEKAGEKVVARATQKVMKETSKKIATKVTKNVSSKAASRAGKELGGKVAKQGVKMAKGAAHKTAGEISKTVGKNTSKKISDRVGVEVSKKMTAKQSLEISTKAAKNVGGKASKEGLQIVGKASQKTSVKMTQNIGNNGVRTVVKSKNAIKESVKTTISETAEGVTRTTTAKKVTEKSVKLTKTTTKISQTSSQEAAKVGMKKAATAGLSAAGISAVIGGVFLYRDLNDLQKQLEEKTITEEEYKERKLQLKGEYAGDVIGSGIVGAAVSVAALTGPAGWAAIGAGALVSFGIGKLGGQVAKSIYS